MDSWCSRRMVGMALGSEGLGGGAAAEGADIVCAVLTERVGAVAGSTKGSTAGWRVFMSCESLTSTLSVLYVKTVRYRVEL